LSEIAKAYQDPGTPEDISRRAFLARATIFTGTIVGLGLLIPVVTSLVPTQELIDQNKGYSPLTKDEFAQLQRTTDKPVKIFFNKLVTDGYYKTNDEYYVWGIKLSPDELQKFQTARPELFAKDPGQNGLDFQVGQLGFVMWSPLCPHLNCKYDWNDSLNCFLCPCHGSEFSLYGVHKRNSQGAFIGPAQRGLDPLPFREQDGMAQVEWVKYAANSANIIRVSYW
jgi:menaquinol-cytochrome c reductase iron-sulfur subunit